MEEKQKVETETPPSSQLITDSTPSSNRKSKNMYIVAGIILLFLVLGGTYLLLGRKTTTPPTAVIQKPTQNTPAQLNQTTPVISPVTSANVDQTLNSTDSKMQQSINQANTDLNSINNIDKSQDSTSGL